MKVDNYLPTFKFSSHVEILMISLFISLVALNNTRLRFESRFTLIKYSQPREKDSVVCVMCLIATETPFTPRYF